MKTEEVIFILKKYEETILEIEKISNKSIFPYWNDNERLKYILEEIEKLNK